jgi:hypothetical protein
MVTRSLSNRVDTKPLNLDQVFDDEYQDALLTQKPLHVLSPGKIWLEALEQCEMPEDATQNQSGTGQ